ncbi:hypothetical protein CRUP_020253 [Coryphaenoides rupestris]|nr:hypothetical protein CRUP_020253 [Coryphaenoides rupestris]
MTSDGKWSSSSDFAQLNYAVCYDADKQGGDRYVLARQDLNGPAAREHCRRYYTDLVSIRNAAENQVVREAAAGRDVWIGLFRDAWRCSSWWKTQRRLAPISSHGEHSLMDRSSPGSSANKKTVTL